MSASNYQQELQELMHVSHVVGCNDQYVQAGGGNTSVKCGDGTTMLIKASGTPLSRMSAQRGWVAVDLPKVRALFERPELRSLNDAQREQEVLKVLSDAVIEPKDARPSVETPLHALLQRTIMHGHPVLANALGCRPDAQEMFARACGSVTERPPLWIPYIDPGSTLAFAVADRVADYVQVNGGTPDVVMQPNHGMFVAADTAADCVIKHQAILENVERLLLEALPDAIDDEVAAAVTAAVRTAYGDDDTILFSRHPVLVRAATSRLADTFRGALSPDHVVYTGPRALIVDGDGLGNLAAVLQTHASDHGSLPRLILLRGHTMCIVGASEKKARAAEALAVSAVQTAIWAGGSVRFLTEKDVSFIVNWEAEHYRAKQ